MEWTEELADLNLFLAIIYISVLGMVARTAYQKLKLLTDRKKREEMDWKDEILPFMVGVLVVWRLYPLTLFSFLPFRMPSGFENVLLSGLIISAGASSSHELIRLLEGLFGRLRKGW